VKRYADTVFYFSFSLSRPTVPTSNLPLPRSFMLVETPLAATRTALAQLRFFPLTPLPQPAARK
jgi:hypothetical protein